MSINSYYAIISLYEWMAERAFSFTTHRLKRAWRSRWFQRLPSQWGHKYTNNISRSVLRVTSWAFSRFIWVKLASYHIHTEIKVFTATRQNKSLVLFEDIATEINISLLITKFQYWTKITIVQQNVHTTTTTTTTTTTKIMKTLRNDQTTFFPCFNFNSKSPLFAKMFKFSII
jgi:hypothetical protein